MSSTPRVTHAGPKGNVYPKYETAHPIERPMIDGFLRQFDACLPTSTPDRILDIGSGEGTIASRLARRFPSAAVFGIDLPDERLATEWRGRRMCGVQGDAMDLPFADTSMDLVVCLEVLEHLPTPGQALAEIARVTAGRAVLSVPLEPLWRAGNLLRGRYLPALGNTPGHLHHWGRRSFQRLVGRHLRVTAVHSPLPWTMVVAEAPRR